MRAVTLRLLFGIVVSAVFLAVTLARVDLPAAAAAMASAAPALLIVALVIVLVDLTLRALRWKVLLDPLHAPERRPSLRVVFGYLMVGFFANAALPARLGDVARAYLAGSDFGSGRLAVFGTIAIERVADGLTMLGLAAISVLVVGAVAGTGDLVILGATAVTLGGLGLLLAWQMIVRTRFGASRIGAMIAGFMARIAGGAVALRQPRSAVAFVALTVIVTATAILIAWLATLSLGLRLEPMEVVLFLSGIALSLAIPAAPSSIGTFEFFGVAILTSLGYSAELGLATILLMRVLTTLPPVLLGVVALWALQIRPGQLLTQSTAGES
jgi:hypothetical protein